MRKTSQALTWLFLAGLIVLGDQASKSWITNQLMWGEVRAYTSYFNLVLVGNPGAAFSFLADAGGWQRWFFVLLSSVVSVVICVILMRKPQAKLFNCGLSLLLGGAIGNLIDRLRFGFVIDFLDVHLGGWHWPAFNLADSAITLAVGLLILDEIRRTRQQRKQPC
jgi:signal peptidase II